MHKPRNQPSPTTLAMYWWLGHFSFERSDHFRHGRWLRSWDLSQYRSRNLDRHRFDSGRRSSGRILIVPAVRRQPPVTVSRDSSQKTAQQKCSHVSSRNHSDRSKPAQTSVRYRANSPLRMVRKHISRGSDSDAGKASFATVGILPKIQHGVCAPRITNIINIRKTSDGIR